MNLKTTLWDLFKQWGEQNPQDKVIITGTGEGELFSDEETDTIAVWHTWHEGIAALQSLVAGKDVWIEGLSLQQIVCLYPDAYEHFSLAGGSFPDDQDARYAICYVDGSVDQVLLTGWIQE